MHKANWDDVRFVLAVAEAGSVARAAQQLGVNHATVLRRVAAFEAEHDVSIFERTAQGYQLRPDAARIIEAARKAAGAMSDLADLLDSERGAGRDLIRVTSVDTLCTLVLGPAMPELQKAARPQRVAILTSNERLDMSRLQADIAVRPAMELPDDLVGEVAMELEFACYTGAEDGAGDIDHSDGNWIGLAGPLARSKATTWLDDRVPVERRIAEADSFLTVAQMAVALGACCAIPRVIGDKTLGLRRLEVEGFDPIVVPVWVAVHRDLADAPRLLSVRRALARVLKARCKPNSD